MTWVDWVLILYVVLFFGVAIVGRSLLLWKRTGINPVRPAREGGIAGLATKSFVGVIVAILLGALVQLFVPGGEEALGKIPWLWSTPVQALGAVLLLPAMAIVIVAQLQMGDSFRIGLDTENATALVERGLYGRSRNPIFLGMRLGLVGLFLVMPNALTLACWLVGDITIQIQVFLEEEFLTKRHGSSYEQFMTRVPRWV